MNNRIKTLFCYINWLRRYSFVNSRSFFRFQNVQRFISQSPVKNKSLLITQVSEIIKTISMHKIDDLSTVSLQPGFSLKQIPVLKPSISKTSSSKEGLSVISIDQFISVYKSHLTKDHTFAATPNHECRLLFQCMTGVRVSSTFNMYENVEYKQKVCNKCKFSNGCCAVVSSSCFPRLKILTTKTTAHELPLIPQAAPCYHLLKKYGHDNIKASVGVYNQHLQTNFQLTSHSLRKFLPNFFINQKHLCNTGNWSRSSRVIQKHYLLPESKYLMLYSFLNNEISS